MSKIDLVKDLVEDEKSSLITRRITSSKNKKFKKENNYSNKEQEQELTDENILESPISKLDGAVPLENIINSQRKTKLIFNKLDEVDSRINNLRNTILNQLSDYDIQIDISKDPLLCTAVKKIFKKNFKYINKQMYLSAIDRLKELQEQRIDKELEDE